MYKTKYIHSICNTNHVLHYDSTSLSGVHVLTVESAITTSDMLFKHNLVYLIYILITSDIFTI